ncbi:MAG: hypothetical protein RR359_01350 [Bacilli bacterium]
MEIIIFAVIIVFVFTYNQTIKPNKFVKDNEMYILMLKEKDYDFYVYSKYGDAVEPNQLFMTRLRNSLCIFAVILILFISQLSFINLVVALVVGFIMYKQQYISLKSFYKKHLNKIDQLLPYYLKSLEILAQNYTIPVALSRSIEDAPIIFKKGLEEMVSKIDAGDSSIDPYMEFSKQYPVKDSMRMMRLLYRLGLGEQKNKYEQLLVFSKSVSSLQNKAREMKYKGRLANMEKRTMVMLVVTGGGTMIILLMSMMMLFGV